MDEHVSAAVLRQNEFRPCALFGPVSRLCGACGSAELRDQPFQRLGM